MPAVVGVLVFTAVSPVNSASLAGRFTSALYRFERSFQDTATASSFRGFQSGRIRVLDLGRREVSFHAYGRVAHDFSDDVASDPSYRLYHGYLRYRSLTRRLTLKAGRQTILVGVGVGRIDGIRGSGRLGSIGTLDLYVGTLVASGAEGIRSWREGHMFGGRFVGAPVAGTTVGVSVYRRSRRGIAYASEQRVLAGLPGLEIRPGEIEQQMIGFDLKRGFGPTTVYARWDVSTPRKLRTRRVEGVLRYQGSRLTLSGEYIYRTPYVDQNSVFAVFTHAGNRETSVRGTFRVNRHLSLFAEGSAVDYDGDMGLRVNAGTSILNGYVGYTARRGFGGVSDGFIATLRQTLHPQVWADLSLNLSWFTTHDGGGSRSLVTSQTFGLHFRPARKASLSLRVQNLSQDLELSARPKPFPGNGLGLRVFVSASTWLFAKGGAR